GVDGLRAARPLRRRHGTHGRAAAGPVGARDRRRPRLGLLGCALARIPRAGFAFDAGGHAVSRGWGPAPALPASLLLHGAAVGAVLWQPVLWPWAAAAVVANHAALVGG